MNYRFISGGSMFYGLAYKGEIAAAQNTVQTGENFYNSDYMLTVNDDTDGLKGVMFRISVK